jgi:YD repeat-containing protein
VRRADVPSDTPTETITPTPTETPIPFAYFPGNVFDVSFKLPHRPQIRANFQSADLPVTINYAYDSLYRLTAADYSDGKYYHYTYDTVGNRLTSSDQSSVISYQYDDANRLSSVNGVSYTWDNNGNLLNDGANTYAYDSANRLTSVLRPQSFVLCAIRV